jgi:hypothetical protein
MVINGGMNRILIELKMSISVYMIYQLLLALLETAPGI